MGAQCEVRIHRRTREEPSLVHPNPPAMPSPNVLMIWAETGAGGGWGRMWAWTRGS